MIPAPPADIPVTVRRKAAAVHEAGHVLVAVLLGRRVSGAILRSPDGLSGETRFEPQAVIQLNLNLAADRRTAEDAIVVLLAGQIAEAEFWRRYAVLDAPVVGSQRDDDAQIRQLMAGFNFKPEEQADFTAHCRRRTAEIVLHPECQAAIEGIAQELCDHRSITRAAIDKIILRHS